MISKSLILSAAVLALSGSLAVADDCLQTSAESCAAPVVTSDGPCFGEFGCSMKSVTTMGGMAIVTLTLPGLDYYRQSGIVGPCFDGNCPNLEAQAENEAVQKTLNVTRFMRYESWYSTPY